MFDGVLFDLDGTLWNATGRICESWNTVLRRHPGGRRPFPPRCLRLRRPH